MSENDSGESLLGLDELLKFTGLNRQLMHAWERRYGLSPERRGPAGRRYYSLAQAERLRRLKQLVDSGHRIGSIADLQPQELQTLAEKAGSDQVLKDFVDAARTLDSQRVAGLLRLRLRQQGTREWILRTVIPLLRHVGDLWSESRLAISSEHVVSLGLKQVLLSLLAEHEVEGDAPVAIVTTLEGELHEFGALTATLLARLEGINALYLGPTLPAKEIATAAMRVKARYVMISTVMAAPDAFLPALADLRQQLPADIVLVVGGRHLQGLDPADNLLVQPDLEGLPALLRTR